MKSRDGVLAKYNLGSGGGGGGGGCGGMGGGGGGGMGGDRSAFMLWPCNVFYIRRDMISILMQDPRMAIYNQSLLEKKKSGEESNLSEL